MLSALFLCALSLPAALAQITCSGLGDFNPTPPFDGWPDPTCPDDPSLELIYEMFSTASGLGNKVTFDRDSVPSNFDSSIDTAFVIHGFLNDEDALWPELIANTIIANNDMNVVVVSWGGPGGSQNINYFQAASTTRTVGAESAEVMRNLIQSGGGSASRMWCVGHSLGAHTCGHMGRWADTQLGYTMTRVTGMDPAGPQFAVNEDRTVGIWTDVADFVDIIHTDRTLGSVPQPGGRDLTLGNQDFFVNDGHSQPGCDTDTCSHLRSYQVFEDSITNTCYEAQTECTASNDIPGSCSNCLICPTMGFDASPGQQGLWTVSAPNASPPFC